MNYKKELAEREAEKSRVPRHVQVSKDDEYKPVDLNEVDYRKASMRGKCD